MQSNGKPIAKDPFLSPCLAHKAKCSKRSKRQAAAHPPYVPDKNCAVNLILCKGRRHARMCTGVSVRGRACEGAIGPPTHAKFRAYEKPAFTHAAE